MVIIGSGFGGLFAAKYLKRADVDITMISRSPYHEFQPLLYQVATGILSQGEIAPATREILKRSKNTEILLGDVTSIDLSGRTVTSQLGDTRTVTEYDSLIVAAGADTGYFGNDQFEPYAPGLKSIDDALEIRARVFGSFEYAELLADREDVAAWMTFVIVGAGPTGVELAGQVVELAKRTLRGDFHRINPADAKVVLVDGGDAVLASFGAKQSQKVERVLTEKMGIDVRLQGLVQDVDADGVRITYRDGRTEHIASHCVLWAAGVQASPLGAQLAQQSGAGIDRSGRVQVNPDLTLPGHPEVFVIGDMIDLNHLPGVAQVAMQGAKFSADTIKDRLNGKDPKPEFHYFDKGSMATISRFRAVANIGKIELDGFLAWCAWAFIHILYLVGFRSKISTLGHWFVAFIGRARAERTFTLEQARGWLSGGREARAPDAADPPAA